MGTFTLREDSEKPILFVAGSTGFAPVKSMVESAFHTGTRRKMVLYWGTPPFRSLFGGACSRVGRANTTILSSFPVLSDPQPDDGWTGRTGWCTKQFWTILTLSKHQVYACGSVQMVKAAQPAFVRHGISTDDCFSRCIPLGSTAPTEITGAAMVKLEVHTMADRSLPRAVQLVLQIIAFGAFAGVLAYFSTHPSYRLRADDSALVKLSFSHAAQLVQACRERTPRNSQAGAEYADQNGLSTPARQCGGGIVDGRQDAVPDQDRSNRAEQGRDRHGLPKLEVPSGRHSFHARLSDTADGAFGYSKDLEVDLTPGQVLIVDFLTSEGGFVFSRG